jgi:glycosyltransferase involved in cell wall biosynthesis
MSHSQPQSSPGPAHVLIACSDFRIGGHSTHTLNFGRALRRRGCRVGAIVPEPFGELYGDFAESLDYVCVLRRGLESRSRYIRRLVQRIAALSPDVIINNMVPPVQAAMPFLPPQLRRVSVVHNVTEYEVALGLANGAWLDWVVSVSNNIGAYVERENRDGVPMATIPVGIEPPAAGRKQAEARTPLRLIYVGRLEPQKNLAGLMRVLTRLHEAATPFSMSIVGGGAELNSLRSQAAACAFGGQIQFLGVQPQRQVARLLDEHDFLVMTSHYEGTPHVVLEAMAHGLVVLASRLPGATDMIINDKVDGFLCDRNKPEEYVSILRDFVAQPAEFGPVSQAARQTAMTRYGSDTFAAQYESLFERANGKRPAPLANAPKVEVLPELRPHFPGLLLQGKHRAADLWRRIARGTRPMGASY